MDLRPKLIVRKGATCRHESRGSPALRAVCTQRYLSSWPIGVVEHRTTRHQGRDVSAGTTAGAHRQYGIRASALRQTLVGMYPLRSDRACGTLSSRAAACRGKKPRPFARERYDRNLKVAKVHIYRPCGSSSSPVLAMATGLMAEAHRHYE